MEFFCYIIETDLTSQASWLSGVLSPGSVSDSLCLRMQWGGSTKLKILVMSMTLPKTFFGYSNFKWMVKELIKMYSGEKSYFSKKRIESGIAFIILQWGMIHWMVINVEEISASDLGVWAGIEGAICGWMISKIQSEKKDIKDNPPTQIG